MYNTDFLPQIERFRRHLFGAGADNPRASSDQANISYCLPSNISLIPCVEDNNGEYVPITALENRVDDSSK
ncbi:MAG: hypothetical protein AABW91_00930 [Nanoarchaeota archaeon]